MGDKYELLIIRGIPNTSVDRWPQNAHSERRRGQRTVATGEIRPYLSNLLIRLCILSSRVEIC